ncbi:two component, sigma54 specific, transcriptional regulator, Fis family [Oceanospirillum multiglobuliferum]|uniref:sigma-54-dependent transcriptional regulator n=1 Tax=Oceanospirillum multiglobuliferum TaxID=64969 RepID=UPI000999F4BC|nr:sigma-54 dependent transcriptional regulator [Oceanospirillum multiglobuliferum]SKA11269.1 two component, sigma54 specific, transcriptional regulator, Fis family [Oceanospirillum multiglobuliferum]
MKSLETNIKNVTKESETAPPSSLLTNTPAVSVLIVDDELGMRSFLVKALSRRFALVESAESIESAEEIRKRCHFDLLICDIKLPGRSGIEWHEALQQSERRSDIIFMTAYAELETAIEALRAGASDFILKPFRLEQMMAAIDRCLERRFLARENFVLKRELNAVFNGNSAMIGESQVIKDVDAIIRRVAPTPSAVLIEGESGTGKELAARALHQHSGRTGAFVPVNCGAIAPDILESELFGHTKGAFTGAQKARDGLFNYASGGTLFLDEIGEMPLVMQAKLLRALELKAVRPVGSEQEVKVDVRIVAATNRNLEHEVKEGRFREDLYYRLNVLTLTLPPLRDRPEDIAALVHCFSRKLSRELGLPPVPFAHEDMASMMAYHWPGNVRELKNFVERCILLGRLPVNSFPESQKSAPASESGASTRGYSSEWALEQVEKHHILQVLADHQGNKSSAARQLGISRKTLDRKLQTWEETSLSDS